MIPAASAPDETKRLASLRALALLDSPPEPRFDRLVRLARPLFDVPIVLISLIDDRREWFKSRSGLPVVEWSREESFGAHAILEDGPLVVPDLSRDERFAEHPCVAGDPGLRFYAAHPLASPDGSPVGVLAILDVKPRRLNAKGLEVLVDLAALAQAELNLVRVTREQLAGHLQADEESAARLREEEEAQALARCRSLVEQVGRLTDATDLGELLDPYVETARAALGAERVTLFWRRQDGQLVSCAAQGMETIIELSPSEGIAGHVAVTRRPYVTNAASTDERFQRRVDAASGFVTQAVLAVPVVAGQDLLGVLEFLNRPGGFGPREVLVAGEVAALAGHLVEHMGQHQRLGESGQALRAFRRQVAEFHLLLAQQIRVALMNLSGALDVLADVLPVEPGGRARGLIPVFWRVYRRLDRQAKDLLYFVRLGRRGAVGGTTVVNLARLVGELLEIFRSDCRDRQVRVTADLQEPLPPVRVNPEEMAHALAGLLANAGNFTPAGGEIVVTVRSLGDVVRIAVGDSGPGVPPEFREKVFEPFFRVPGRPEATGTGIGLAVVKGIVERHGGQVRVESTQGGGRFIVELPLQH